MLKYKQEKAVYNEGGSVGMGMYLNSIAPYEKYKETSGDLYFIDKTKILEELIPVMSKMDKYICITRPRRFGKTVMANMIAAFLGKAYDSSAVFNKLKIAESNLYKNHLNSYDVIYIDFSETPEICRNYEQYITRIIKGLKNDFKTIYPELNSDSDLSIWDMITSIFEKYQQKFVFIIDEWDAVFHMSFMTEKDKTEYMLFLKSLLKSKAYVSLAYMTGVLPISKYSSGSELNMFMEYDMSVKIRFSNYFGFTENEVEELYGRYIENNAEHHITLDGLTQWYDGYHTASGERMYNPRSVVCALMNNQLTDYWTNSGPYDEIFFYIKNNIDDIRDDLALMISGERVRVKIQDYAAVSMELKTRNQIYSAMVVYGLLTYEDGEVFIPNEELMIKFSETLQEHESLGYIYRLARESEKMLRATLENDTETMAQILQYTHDTETPILSYNHETELSAVVNLAYLSARDRYRIEREDKAGRGYVDFIFYPVKPADDCIILELKVNDTPENAIEQIKKKQYAVKFKGKIGETSRYKGRILAVGISYNKKDTKHYCKVEILQ